jgi:hypothetical protein
VSEWQYPEGGAREDILAADHRSLGHSVTRSLVVAAACVCVTGQVKPRPSEVIACVCVCVCVE